MTGRLPEWAKQIKTLRQKCGLTQKTLASRLGIAKKIVADWEQGKQQPSSRRYVQLAKMAGEEQALWFLNQIGIDAKLLCRLAPRPNEKAKP